MSFQDSIELASMVISCLVIIATILVHVTPSKKDDEYINALATKFHSIMAYLPTFGVNPKTKELEAQLKKLQEKLSKLENGPTA